MNDDFLHRLRETPPPAFATRLKARLNVLSAKAAPARRPVTLRAVLLGVLIGGAAFAVTAISIRGVPPLVTDWFAPERAPPSTSNIPPASAAPRQVFPGELVVPQENPIAPPTALRRADRAPVQLTSQPVERAAGTGSVSAPVVSSLPVNAGPDGSRREFVKVAVAKATHPFARLIADELALQPQSLSVKIEIQGSGGALRTFCLGPDFWFPDMAITSRRMQPEELQACWRNGVRVVHEINVGRQTVVLVQNLAGHEMKFTRREIFLALGKHTPRSDDPAARVAPNSATIWPQITRTGIGNPIQVVGPERESALALGLIDLLFEPGCRSFPSLAGLRERDAGGYESICRSLRTDGVYVEHAEDLDAIAQNVRATPGAIGVLHYNYFDSHREALIASQIEGIAPSAESIAAGTYPASRVLYLYVKDPNLRSIPGLMQFLNAFREAATARGRFFSLGLTPAPEADRRMRTLTLQDLQQP
jgi:phosphate transport system substrate-binding protein